MPKIDIKVLARFILLHCIKNQISVNHFKLQKLLYYSQAWHLVYFDKEDLFDELPQAWVNGPVYRSVYEDWKHIYAAKGITLTAEDLDNLEALYSKTLEALNVSESQQKFLASILNHYGLMSHEKLIMMTHREDPWNIAREGLGDFEYSEKAISKESMYEYYSKALASAK